MPTSSRVGHGLDAHRLTEGRPLVIGGITVPSDRGADAHSDGDVLLHALADALLSTHALGDIGKLFPPSDAKYAGMNSQSIVEHVLEKLEAHAGKQTVINVAAVVTLDKPKLGAHREDISANVAAILGIPNENVGVTFKTSEGMAPNHIQASVVLAVILAN